MANAIINVGQTGGQINISTAAAPATPAAGVVTLYAGTDKALHALNSDGTDITIAAAGSASPITVQQTNSLVSTAIGATASVSNAIVIGATASATTNSIVIGRCASASQGSNTSQLGGIVIGNGACLFGAGTDQSIAIGQNACANGNDSGVGRVGLAIGLNAKVDSSLGGVAIGTGTCVTNTSVAVGWIACSEAENSSAFGLASRIQSGADFSLSAAGYLNCITTGSKCSNAIGSYITISSCVANGIGWGSTVCSGSNLSTVIGNVSTIFPGATGTMVLGNSSVGGTAACNSVVIGNSSRATAACSVVIGQASCATAASSVAIGNSKNAPGPFDINIGGCTTNSIVSTGGNNIIIGGLTSCILQGSRSSIIGSYNSCVNSSNGYATIIGSGNSFICGTQFFGFLGGAIESCATGYSSVIIGAVQSCLTNNNGAYSGIYSGGRNTISSSSNNNVILGGCCGTIGSNYTNTVIIGGNAITADSSNTVFVPNLKVTGQAASVAHAVGSTGGAVAINWDNSNVQTLTLTSSATVTMSNPIDGGVYTLQITQGGAGSNTATWSNIKWPGGTPPTLSTAVGALDVLTFIYGPTAYVGNANLNFS